LNFESKIHEAQIEDQKSKKSSRGSSKKKTVKPANDIKSEKPSKMVKKRFKKLKLKTPPETNSL
jgi:hypothetical protein